MEWLAMALAPGEARKGLSADALFRSLRSHFGTLPDPRSGEVEIPLGDALMSAFAMFSLKDPSLLAFDDRRCDPNDNFRTIYRINRVPSDSQMRAILDPVNPAGLRAPYREAFRRLQRGKVLERFVYLDGHYLLSLDGTTYFSSTKIHCPSCLVKHHRNGGVTYSHQLLGATLVHPDLKEVLPLAPEPIIQQDGQTKNDCERNATRRWLKRFRREHPRLPVIVVEDGLSANAPHLRDLRVARAHFIIGVQPGDHAFLFEHWHARAEAGLLSTLSRVDPETGVLHHYLMKPRPLAVRPEELRAIRRALRARPLGRQRDRRSRGFPGGSAPQATGRPSGVGLGKLAWEGVPVGRGGSAGPAAPEGGYPRCPAPSGG